MNGAVNVKTPTYLFLALEGTTFSVVKPCPRSLVRSLSVEPRDREGHGQDPSLERSRLSAEEGYVFSLVPREYKAQEEK